MDEARSDRRGRKQQETQEREREWKERQDKIKEIGAVREDARGRNDERRKSQRRGMREGERMASRSRASALALLILCQLPAFHMCKPSGDPGGIVIQF
jgi:hypothetical protein